MVLNLLGYNESDLSHLPPNRSIRGSLHRDSRQSSSEFDYQQADNLVHTDVSGFAVIPFHLILEPFSPPREVLQDSSFTGPKNGTTASYHVPDAALEISRLPRRKRPCEGS